MKTRIQTLAAALSVVALAAMAGPATLAHKAHHHERTAHDNAHQRSAPGAHAKTVRDLVKSFRRSGDDRYLDRAWTLVQQGLIDGATPARDLVDAAFVAQARHHFDEALEFLDDALAIRPDDDQAWLLRASVLQVRGDHAGAADACRRLGGVLPVVIVACHARTVSDEHDARAAARRMHALLRVTDLGANPELEAWLLGVVADLDIVAGHVRPAELGYRRSLALDENVQVRAALADLLISGKRLTEAADVLGTRSEALPLAVRRLIVARQMHGEEAAHEDVAHMDSVFQGWIKKGDWLHAREMARFYLDVLARPDLARTLAARNLTTQREREDLALALRTGVAVPGGAPGVRAADVEPPHARHVEAVEPHEGSHMP